MKDYGRDKNLRDASRTQNSKLGTPFLHPETIDLSIALFEPPLISYEISQIEVGSKQYMSAFTLETGGRIVHSDPNVESFELRRCRIEMVTVPDNSKDVLGCLAFHDDAFFKYEEYLGEFRFEFKIQLIRDLILYLQLNNLKPDRQTDQESDEYTEDNSEFRLTPIKALDLRIENERGLNQPTETNPTGRLIIYDVTRVRFLLYPESLSNYDWKVRQLLRRTERFCQYCEAVDHKGAKVSPNSIKAERRSLLGAIKACYSKGYSNDEMIVIVANHIVEKNPSYKDLKEQEAIIRAFNDQEGYEAVKRLVDELDV